MRFTGIMLMMIGAIALVRGNTNYNRQRAALEVASFRVTATATRPQHMLHPPVFGGVLVLGGFLLVASPRRQFV